MGNKAVAITGMACIFPGAHDLDAYWKNILACKSAISPIPKERNTEQVIAEENDEDAIICTHGAFLDPEIPFSPLEYGVMPSVCEMGDPEQLLILKLADRALKDSGIDPQKEDLKSTEIILGRGGYLGSYLQQGFQKIEVIPQIISILDQLVPGISREKLAGIKAELKSCFGHLSTEKAALAVPNINTGRIANRFNIMGANYTIDAACASALIAAENAVMSLRQDRCERVITGGSFLANNPSFWWLFSRLDAFSSSSSIKPFSKLADGMLAGEGIGILVFERLEDAVNAGRRVYAVIRGIGTSSDGRGTAVLAPRKEGQIECLRRAYRDAGLDPRDIELLEGHGTATKIGDQIELAAINEFFGPCLDGIPTRALGSVKSMIGHTMPASGAASLIKIALSLYHKILPPTLCGGEISDGLKDSSFYLNTAARPWIYPKGEKRRAGINAFGFGGINGHAVLEEYLEEGAEIDDLVMDWPMELFLLAGNTVDELQSAIHDLLDKAEQYRAQKKMFGLLSMDVCKTGDKFLDFRLSIIAEDFDALSGKLCNASDFLKETRGEKTKDTDGIYFESAPLKKSGKIVFVFPGNAFPGLGDEYTDRLGELCLYLPCFRQWFDQLDKAKALPGRSYRFSTLMFPPTKIDHETYVDLKRELRILDNSASGVFLANTAGHDLMARLGVFPDMITGTSLGEWSAAVAGGMIELEQVAAMNVYAQGEQIDEIKGAVGLTQCHLDTLQPYLDEFNRENVRITCSMDLSPGQMVFGGERDAVDQFCKILNEAGIWCKYLNLFPIHTPLCRPIADLIYRRLEGLRVSTPIVPVFSAATAEEFPTDAEKMRVLLADNAVLPVKMRTLFTKLHDEGARIFLQLGGGGKIATPITETLAGKPFTILSLDVSNRHPVHQLQHLIASLYAHHVEVKPDLLFDARRRCLKRSAVEKNKSSELVVKLPMAIPKFQIRDEHLDLHPETQGAAVTAFPEKTTVSDARHAVLESTASPMSEWEEVLAEQMNAMTRMYTLQKEDELADMTHFTHMLECQARFLMSAAGGVSSSPLASPMASAKAYDRPVGRPSEPLPFIGRIEDHVQERKIVIRRTLSLTVDLFLMDHAFIPCPDHIKPPDEKLPTLPMAVALEIIAEAAQTLFPGKMVCGLKNIQNKRWINLTETIREKDLIITAQAKKAESSGEIETECTIAVDSDEREICFFGIVLLADQYYAGDKALSIGGELKAAQTFDNIDPKLLYRPGGLYHGACFQGMEAIVKTTDKGVEAMLTVPSLKGFFAGRSGGAMILPAQTIDAASQQICCYDMAMGTRNMWVAPVSIERILIYKPSPAAGTQVKSKMIIRSNDNNLVRFDVLLETHGEVFMIIIGWRDWRMKWSDRLLASWQHPDETLLARKKQSQTTLSNDYYAIYAIEPKDLSGIDPDWPARLYLNASEYKQWRAMPQERQSEKLMETIVIKDAVRGLLRQKDLRLYPSQVAVRQVSQGQFSVRVDGGGRGHSKALSVLTARQNNEIIAMAVSEHIEELPDFRPDNVDDQLSKFIMSKQA